MSPVCSMSPVHSSAFELPFRHSIDSTEADFAADDESDLVGESAELPCARSMVILLTANNYYAYMYAYIHIDIYVFLYVWTQV